MAHANASDWNVMYASNDDFRGILCSYFTWDHPYQRFFDESCFFRGVQGEKSEMISELLVHAIIAYGAVGVFLPSN